MWRVGRDPYPNGRKPKKLGWDCPLPLVLQQRWDNIAKEMKTLRQLQIPRSLRLSSFPQVKHKSKSTPSVMLQRSPMEPALNCDVNTATQSHGLDANLGPFHRRQLEPRLV
ncbi:hypothetical protein DAPPUDRAFT_245810 [Daphnia pulex]|uniref:Uncharacterized protein n=1 Tax=Daphnia pulex TaxID=6669 RepID=E9GP41_DAPPU|nr:hypothetical protein DAPPUDRAFT_245810 [Daphnia pulex]|eukprot:EFX78747.1 hypothetical protein DAPPUDRAFT_245810 [Daphnia pulex]